MIAVKSKQTESESVFFEETEKYYLNVSYLGGKFWYCSIIKRKGDGHIEFPYPELREYDDCLKKIEELIEEEKC